MQQDELKEWVYYCPITGVFTRKKAAGNTKAGSRIGNVDAKGYLKAMVLGKYVKLHQLAWFYVYGVWPPQLDHKNQVKTDNRIDNLREANTSINCLNQTGPRKNNKLGTQGVHKTRKTGRYRACCNVNGKKHHLGVFATEAEAASVYQNFKQQYLPQ